MNLSRIKKKCAKHILSDALWQISKERGIVVALGPLYETKNLSSQGKGMTEIPGVNAFFKSWRDDAAAKRQVLFNIN